MTDEACICGVTCCIDGEQYGYCESDSCDGMCVALGPCPCKCHDPSLVTGIDWSAGHRWLVRP